MCITFTLSTDKQVGVDMFYFLCFITFICVFNLLIMGFILYKFGIDVFFMNDKEPSKEYPLKRSQ